MRQSRLDLPDQTSENSEHAHSPTLASVLSSAYLELARGAFENAGRLVLPYRGWPMAAAQRLRLLFILATASQHRQDYVNTISICEEAIAICASSDWYVETAQLALVCAEAHHELQQFAAAGAVAAKGLSAWLALDPSRAAADVRLEIDLRDRFSLELFLLGQYTDALQQAGAARRLAGSLPSSRRAALRAAGLDWTLALLHRWSGDWGHAQRQIRSTLATYERFGSSGELARLRIVVADITLDALAPLGVGIARHYREDLIQHARTQLTLVLDTIGAGALDPAARCMALLAHARLNRALGVNEDRLTLLESIGHQAERLHDLPLLGQVYTALGDEFGSMGRLAAESQKNCYRRALGVVEGSQAPAYGAWPLRGLLRESEYRDQ